MSEWIIKASDEFRKMFKDLTKKDIPLRNRIIKSIEKLKENPYAGKPLSYDLAGLRSLRVGRRYRVIYKVDEKNKIIWLVSVGHRDDIY